MNVDEAEAMRQRMQDRIDRQKIAIDRLLAERSRVYALAYDNQDQPVAQEILKAFDDG